MIEKQDKSCMACGHSGMEIFYRVESVPVNSCLLLESAQVARSINKGSIQLGFCNHCGFISNLAFDPKLTEYSGRYEETQGFSPTFREFNEGLARDLIARHDLHNKKVVEIGCGKGEFLHLLCAFGDNEGLGFDPSYVESRDQPIRAQRIQFVQDFFSEKYPTEADFVCCKMTLEHIPETRQFVNSIRQTVRGDPGSEIFIQVPEAARILQHCAFEDIYYEHCSYFTPTSLAALLSSIGFDEVKTDIQYDGQYLTAEAKYGSGLRESQASVDTEGCRALASLVASFQNRVATKIFDWRQDIGQRSKMGQKIVLWGSGSKGVSFLTTLELNREVEHVVDINPHRQGYYMAGTGQLIVSPEDLQEIRPDYVVVMNSVYVDEIRQTLAGLGLTPELASL